MIMITQKIQRMSNPINISDNCLAYNGRPLTEQEKEDLQKLALPSISDLANKDNGGLLVFPPDLNTYGDEIGEQHIVQYWNNTLQTGNIMGFVGINDTRLRIHSRFATGDDDYFLHYMLQKVFSVNLFDLKHSSDSEDVFDFLIYLFPYFLKKALRLGLFKTYQRYSYNDANVRGTIDVARHLRQNMPFAGRIAYNTREYSYDNDITELIRHTIEYIDSHPFGKGILENDNETIDDVEKIRMSTPSYQQRELRTIIGKNIRPLNHPYYTEYRPLQQICLRILLHEELKYGRKKDDIYGILFDGAWLWEEYLNTILCRCGFNHPRNKKGEGGIRVFKNSPLRFYPDFWRKDFVLDAKYKNYGEYSVQSKDYHQLIAYMYLLQMKRGGFLVPYANVPDANKKDLELVGYGGNIKVYGLTVGTQCVSYAEFVNYMNTEENKLINKIQNERILVRTSEMDIL